MKVVETVWTPDKHVGKDLNNSPLWDKCYKESEMTDELKASKKIWYIYHVKFDDLTPTQITKSEEYK